MNSSFPVTFLPGWGYKASITLNCFSFSPQLLDLPPAGTMATISHAIEEKIHTKSSILMGWSLGGLISMNLYERYPKRYKALILIASTPCFWAQNDWPGISKAYQAIFEKNLNKSYEDFSAYYHKLISSPFHSSTLSDQLVPHMIAKDIFDLHKPFKDILFQSDFRLAFSKIQIPTLVIQGDKDSIISSEINRNLLKLNPGLEYHTIRNSGHIPFITHKNKTNKIINKFLSEL